MELISESAVKLLLKRNQHYIYNGTIDVLLRSFI